MRLFAFFACLYLLLFQPVYAQEPLSKEELAAIVYIILGDNPIETSIPQFLGLQQDVAQQVIDFLELDYVEFEPVNDDQSSAGTIVGQSIDAGVYDGEPGKLILYVSRGYIQVPNLLEMPYGEVSGLLEAESLELGSVIGVISNSLAEGLVTSQNPLVGAGVKANTKVDIGVSLGSSDGGITVPDLSGMTVSAASSALSSANLQLGSTSEQNSNSIDIGLVLDQTPAAGAKIYQDAPIDIVVSSSIGRSVVINQPDPIDPEDLSDLPVDDNSGLPLLIEFGDGGMVYDANLNSPLTAWGDCLAIIITCRGSDSNADFDDCAFSAPACGTSQPWLEETVCCPAQCYEEYRIIRLAGSNQTDAFAEVYIEGTSCFPGR